MYQIEVTEPTGVKTRIVVAHESSRDVLEDRLRADGMDFESTAMNLEPADMNWDCRDTTEKERAFDLIAMLLD